MYIEEFRKYLEFEKRYSIHTVKSYLLDLTQFFLYIEQNKKSISFENINSKVIRQWIVSLMENNLTPKTLNRKISTLKTYYKFLLKEKIVEVNPLEKVISPKVKKQLPYFVDKNKMNELLDEIKFEDNFEGVRDKLIIEIFYYTGIRLSELVNLKIKDIDFINLSIKVLGKRNKERIIPINNKLKSSITYYLNKRAEISNAISVMELFVTSTGKKIYSKLVYRVVHLYLSMVTSLEKRSPHVLRHTFATQMLNNGADLNSIKEILGHANLTATQVYTHNTFEKLKKVYKQAHPRA